MRNADSKIDPELAFELASKSEETVFGVVVRIDTPFTSERRGALEQAGVDINSEAGDILTCRASSRAIRTMSQYDFVRSIQGGRLKLY